MQDFSLKRNTMLSALPSSTNHWDCRRRRRRRMARPRRQRLCPAWAAWVSTQAAQSLSLRHTVRAVCQSLCLQRPRPPTGPLRPPQLR